MSGILTVCDANVCRSVAAEMLLASEFGVHSALAGITVTSRGAKALAGHGTCRMVAELRDDEPWLKRAREHQAHQLDAAAIEEADLILTAGLSTRSAVVSLVPGARRRVFTMREALWMAAGFRPSAGARGDALIRDFASHLDAQRGLHQPPVARGRLWRPAENPFDIVDAHGAGRRAHAAAIAQVQETMSGLVHLLIQDPTLPFLANGESAIR
jgi:protein-tyrosine phosphatase